MRYLRPELPLKHDHSHYRAIFSRHFGTDHQCRAHLIRLRFPGGLRCQRCDRTDFRITRHHAHCPGCSLKVSLTAGTIFHSTKHTLLRWFKAAFYLITIPNLRAKRLAVLINVSQKTAWTWARKLRHVAGELLGAWCLRAAERTCWPSSRLQDADFADPATCKRHRWRRFSRDRGGPRPDDDPLANPARRFLLPLTSGHVSDKHLPAYLDHFAFVKSFSNVIKAFLYLATGLPRSSAKTYRDLVGKRVARPWLLIERREVPRRWSSLVLGPSKTCAWS